MINQGWWNEDSETEWKDESKKQVGFQLFLLLQAEYLETCEVGSGPEIPWIFK